MTVRDQYDTSSRLKYDQRGRSMISTGMAGTPDQSYSPKSASRIFVKTLASTGPPAAWMRARAARHGRVVDRHAGHLHGEVGLDGGRQVGGPPSW